VLKAAFARKNRTDKTQNIEPKPKTVRTVNYKYAYAKVIAVLIIFPVILQTVINLIMLSTGGQEATEADSEKTKKTQENRKMENIYMHQSRDASKL